MLKLAVFQGDRQDSESSAYFFVQQINQAAKKPIANTVKYSNLVFEFSKNEAVVKLAATGERIENLAKAYYIRDYHGYHSERYALATYLAHKGKEVFNSDVLNNEPLSKLEQLAVFVEAGLAVPESVFVNQPDLLKAPFSYPYVIKSITSSNNRLNFLVKSDKQRKKAIKKIGNKLLLQEYIENDGDYKAVIMLGQSLAIYKRTQTNGYIPDSRVRVPREVVDAPDVTTLAVKTANVLKREFCSVDIVRNKEDGQLYILECNFNSGFHMAGLNIDTDLFAKTAALIQQKL